MKQPENLFLIGPMGSGKSTIGRQLADLLKMDFVDSDQEIESRAGADISWIFDVEGEDGFRVRESNVIQDLTERKGIVLATGGGAILEDAARTCLAARGTVIYLKASIEQQMKRTYRDRRRPLLANLEDDDNGETYLRLQAEREPFYQEIADFTVSTDDRSVRTVAQEVVNWLERNLL